MTETTKPAMSVEKAGEVNTGCGECTIPVAPEGGEQVSDDNRERCPVCECVMHGNRHYGSDRTHILVRTLKATVTAAQAELAQAKEEIARLNEICDRLGDAGRRG